MDKGHEFMLEQKIQREREDFERKQKEAEEKFLRNWMAMNYRIQQKGQTLGLLGIRNPTTGYDTSSIEFQLARRQFEDKQKLQIQQFNLHEQSNQRQLASIRNCLEIQRQAEENKRLELQRKWDEARKEPLNEEVKKKLRQFYNDIVLEVEPASSVMDILFAENIINGEDRERIRIMPLRMDGCRKMLDMVLLSSDQKAGKVFARALKKEYYALGEKIGTNCYVEEIKQSLTTTDPVPEVATSGDKSIVEKWTKFEKIGSGAFGTVYKGYDNVSKRQIAIKQILTPAGSQQKDIQELCSEIEILKDLQHPRIVQYYGCEESNGELFIFMEYLEGGTIRDEILKKHRLDEGLINKYSRQVIEGLVYLHGRNIVHRDIKGANILRDANDDVKIADFGISKQVQAVTAKQSSRITKVGTVQYMAPEVMLEDGEKHYGQKADIWSLGCTVVEMLTGNPPWEGLRDIDIMRKMDRGIYPTFNLPEETSDAAKSFLLLCFKQDPAERPTASQLLNNEFSKSLQ